MNEEVEMVREARLGMKGEREGSHHDVLSAAGV